MFVLKIVEIKSYCLLVSVQISLRLWQSID